MTGQGRDYHEVLAEAQAAGFAEADPSADVEGHDALDKLILLARLAFGVWLDPTSIRRATTRADGRPGAPGITGVTAADIEAAARAGYTLKLVVAAERVGTGVAAAVRTSAVAAGTPLALTGGPENRIEVTGEPVGRVAFAGPGAGGSTTSSAVLGDLLAVARHAGSTWAGLPPAPAGLVPAREPGIGELFVGPSGARYPVIDR
jgi:homoserine dehydrogenase